MFILNTDAKAYACDEFTSTWSVFVGGGSDTFCLAPAKSGERIDSNNFFPKGTVVHVVKVKTQRLVDSYSKLAVLAIGDAKNLRKVYADWPRCKALFDAGAQ